MRIKNTAFIYNVTVNGSSNCDWGTDIGQSKKHTFTLEGFPEFINAMVYYKIDDVDNIQVVLGKGNRTPKPFAAYNDIKLVLASCFTKVYLNEQLLEGQKFIAYIVKEINDKNALGQINVHKDRCTLKYSNSLLYRGDNINQKCIDAISTAFGQSTDGSWAILEMDIKNEDELHLYGFALGDAPKDYSSTEERNNEFEKFFSGDDLEFRRAAFKAYLFAPGTFKTKGTAQTYWSHISNPKYKERISFVWSVLSSLIGYQTDDLMIVNDIATAKKLKDIITPLPENKKYGAQLASAIIKNYVDFLENRHIKYVRSNSEHGPKTITPTGEEFVFHNQDYRYMAAIKTKPFIILGGFSGTGKSQKVKELAFATCPCDGVLNNSETSPGNYLLISVKPNWHDATDITGFRSSVKKNYYVTDFMRFLVKAKQYEEKHIPFFVCLDEMNLAPVEEYFADFLSVIESRKRCADGNIVTDAIVPSSVFNDSDYDDGFNIFLKLGLEPTNPLWKADDINALPIEEQAEAFVRQDIVDELKRDGLTIPSNVIIIGTVNMDDTTNTFSRKVIDRAMTFETIVGEFGVDYFKSDVPLHYFENPKNGELFLSDEVRATQMIEESRFILTEDEQKKILDFINHVNEDLEGSPFKISYRILNETILLYRSKKKIQEIIESEGGFEEGIEYHTDLNNIFDDILMQKVLPRIEGDYEKCSSCLTKLSVRAEDNDWTNSLEKIEFMIKRFGTDKSGFTTFWN